MYNRLPEWLNQCYLEQKAQIPANAPAIPGLVLCAAPVRGRKYAIGADPAEGNPTSDNSSLHVLDALTGEEVASLGELLSALTRANQQIAALTGKVTALEQEIDEIHLSTMRWAGMAAEKARSLREVRKKSS